MGKYEDLLERARDEGLDDDLIAELEEFGATTLRKKAARADELEAENTSLKAQIEARQQEPVKIEAFKELGIDFDQLRPTERRALLALDHTDADVVSEFARENELPMREATDQGNTDAPPAAAGIAQTAQSAPAKGGLPVLKPEDVNDWPVDKLMRLREAHPEAWESLKRGDTVTGIAFS